jgi:hypothetical protein
MACMLHSHISLISHLCRVTGHLKHPMLCKAATDGILYSDMFCTVYAHTPGFKNITALMARIGSGKHRAHL